MILKKIGNAAYHLELPEHLKIHPIFHVSNLKKYHEDVEDPSRSKLKRAPPTVRVTIGLNSSRTSGLSTLGISSRKVEKKFDTALHAAKSLMIPQQT